MQLRINYNNNLIAARSQANSHDKAPDWPHGKTLTKSNRLLRTSAHLGECRRRLPIPIDGPRQPVYDEANLHSQGRQAAAYRLAVSGKQDLPMVELCGGSDARTLPGGLQTR